MFIRFVVKHALCDRQTHGQMDRQNYDCQDRTSIAASRGTQKSVNTDSGTGITVLLALGLVNPWTRGPWDKWDDTTTKLSNSVSIL